VGYGHFLKANNQPAGKETYNEVISWLLHIIKYGTEALLDAKLMPYNYDSRLTIDL
jgi:hypothetical protein